MSSYIVDIKLRDKCGIVRSDPGSALLCEDGCVSLNPDFGFFKVQLE